ncbi:MAG: [FeFe] hydrogenase H-cluster radical SAM maturase HydE [Clostridiaceae bacterium]|nr:[FeFe] hydrogenase H-cluster radical SAM maturase HydE [Clostridiaceae bacterium]
MPKPWDDFKVNGLNSHTSRSGKLKLLEQVINLLQTDQLARHEAYTLARDIRDQIYGPAVFFRGLIEISNFCVRDCYYCGIRNSKSGVNRYRLTREQIMSCCQTGFDVGYRTVVLQGGEDPCFTIDDLVAIVSEIRQRWPDMAITLSLGEMSSACYQRLYDAGADRYLLRHETANKQHYSSLHPSDQIADTRMDCLRELKRIGFQTGAGMMIGSPGQTKVHLAEDLLFLAEFQPQMVGIGPFMPASGTPFSAEPAGSLDNTLIMLALTRILVPAVLLPATTALGSLDPAGRKLGLLAGANVIMPNLSPPDHRADYLLYDGKVSAADDVVSNLEQMVFIVEDAGMFISSTRGDAAVI